MEARSVVRWLLAAACVVGGGEALAQPAPPGASQPKTARETPRVGVVDVAHVKTVAAAIDSLPGPLKAFFKAHRAEMPSQALEPEFPPRSPERRFLVDRLLPFPFAELPRSEPALRDKFGDKTEGLGRLPWLIQESYGRLVEAMKAGDRQRILTEADVLGGLMVDCHSVLNLTENFDGQKTNQHGLYVRLTSKLPEALGPGLKLSPDAARYLDDPKEYVFSMLVATYVWLDNALYLEELAKRGKSGYGEIYFEDLAHRLGPILRERLSSAAQDAGSYWYTAWTVAGRPALR